MHSIHWPADYMPGNTENFASGEIIAQDLYPPLSEPAFLDFLIAASKFIHWISD